MRTRGTAFAPRLSWRARLRKDLAPYPTAEDRCPSAFPELLAQPCARKSPVGLNGRDADSHQLSDLAVFKTAKKAVLNDFRWPWADSFQFLETLMNPVELF